MGLVACTHFFNLKYNKLSAYKKSDGTYITKKTLDYRIENNKNEYTMLVSEKLHIEIDNIPCERCKLNNRFASGVSRSHIMSVDYCQRNSMAEYAYCPLNLEHLCIECHRKLESNSNIFREGWYWFRLDCTFDFVRRPNIEEYVIGLFIEEILKYE